MKLFDQHGHVIMNCSIVHFYPYGYGSDPSKQARRHHNISKELYDEKMSHRVGCESDQATVAIMWDSPYHNETAQLLAKGIAVCSLKDSFNKKRGVLIALSRAAFKLGKKVIKRTLYFGGHKETRYILMDR